MTVVRVASDTDVFELAALHVRAWQAAYRGIMPDAFLDQLDVAERQRQWARLIGAGSPPLLIEDAGKLLGFAHTGSSRDGDADANVGELRVLNLAPEAWGKGYAAPLHDSALEQLAVYSSSTLWVVDANARARRFYEKHGWIAEPLTLVRNFGGTAVTELRYRRGSARSG